MWLARVGDDLAGAWMLATRRLRTERAVLAALVLTVLLSATVLASGPIYADTVAAAGVRSALADAAVDAAGIRVAGRVAVDDIGRVDGEVRDRVGRSLGGVVADTVLVAESDPLQGPDRPGERTSVSVAIATGLLDQVELTGTTPGGSRSGQPLEAVVHADAAAAAGWRIGDDLTFETLAGRDLRITLVGTYVPTDAGGPYWFADPILRDGTIEGQDFTSLAPFVADVAAFVDHLEGANVSADWRLTVPPDAVTQEELPGVPGRVAAFRSALDQVDVAGALRIDTDLPALARDLGTALTTTRAGVVTTILQLGVLCLYALGLVAGALVDSRQVETALIRARGARPAQLALAAAVEGLLLGIPAVLLGPWLGRGLVAAVTAVGPLAAADVRTVAAPGPAATAEAVAAALAGVVILVVPAARSARLLAEARAEAGRPLRPPLVQRAGLDLILLAFAVVGALQLRRFGGAAVSDLEGRLGLDPLLILAPAAGLLAGALLTLRLVPLAGRLGERWARARRTLVPALGAWELGRRPGRTARTALLLVLAVAVGVFALAYAGTWTRSQRDQATVRAGGDVLVDPDRRATAEVAAADLPDAYRGIDGVTAVDPIDLVPLVLAGERTTLVATDPVALDVRDDLATPAGAPAALVRDPADRPGVPVQGEEVRVVVAVDPPTSGGVAFDDATLGLDALLFGPAGLPVQVDLGTVRADGDAVTLSADLPADGPSGSWRVAGVVLRLPRLPIPGGALGSTGAYDVDVRVDLGGGQLAGTVTGALAERGGPGGFDSATLRTSDGPPEPVPALLTPAALTAAAAAIGDTVQVAADGVRLPLRVAGTIEALPTDPAAERGILVDLGAYAAARWQAEGATISPDRYVLTIEPDATAAVTEALRSPPLRSRSVLAASELTQRLAEDPVTLGLIGALLLAFGPALALALVAHATSNGVTARERRSEFALLHALGGSARTVRRWLVLEAGTTTALSLVTGTLVGVALAWLVLPAAALTPDGTPTVPSPRLVLPWATLAALLGLLAAGLLAIPLAISRRARRLEVAAVIRRGEER